MLGGEAVPLPLPWPRVLLMILDVSWLLGASRQFLPLLSDDSLPVCLCVASSLKRTPVMFGRAYPEDLILT